MSAMASYQSCKYSTPREGMCTKEDLHRRLRINGMLGMLIIRCVSWPQIHRHRIGMAGDRYAGNDSRYGSTLTCIDCHKCCA